MPQLLSQISDLRGFSSHCQELTEYDVKKKHLNKFLIIPGKILEYDYAVWRVDTPVLFSREDTDVR